MSTTVKKEQVRQETPYIAPTISLPSTTQITYPGGYGVPPQDSSISSSKPVINPHTGKPKSPDPEGHPSGIDVNSVLKRFGWETIDGTPVPTIFRSDIPYTLVRIVEDQFLKDFPPTFSEQLGNKPPLVSHYVTPAEAKLFNEINLHHCNSLYGTEEFKQDQLIVKVSEFREFLSLVKSTFPEEVIEAVNLGIPLPNLSELREKLCGWIQVNNTISPYIRRDGKKFVISNVMRHAAQLPLNSKHDEFLPTEQECQLINKLCQSAGFDFQFGSSTKFVSLDKMREEHRLKIVELPEQNPRMYAKYTDGTSQQNLLSPVGPQNLNRSIAPKTLNNNQYLAVSKAQGYTHVRYNGHTGSMGYVPVPSSPMTTSNTAPSYSYASKYMNNVNTTNSVSHSNISPLYGMRNANPNYRPYSTAQSSFPHSISQALYTNSNSFNVYSQAVSSVGYKNLSSAPSNGFLSQQSYSTKTLGLSTSTTNSYLTTALGSMSHMNSTVGSSNNKNNRTYPPLPYSSKSHKIACTNASIAGSSVPNNSSTRPNVQAARHHSQPTTTFANGPLTIPMGSYSSLLAGSVIQAGIPLPSPMATSRGNAFLPVPNPTNSSPGLWLNTHAVYPNMFFPMNVNLATTTSHNINVTKTIVSSIKDTLKTTTNQHNLNTKQHTTPVIHSRSNAISLQQQTEPLLPTTQPLLVSALSNIAHVHLPENSSTPQTFVPQSLPQLPKLIPDTTDVTSKSNTGQSYSIQQVIRDSIVPQGEITQSLNQYDSPSSARSNNSTEPLSPASIQKQVMDANFTDTVVTSTGVMHNSENSNKSGINKIAITSHKFEGKGISCVNHTRNEPHALLEAVQKLYFKDTTLEEFQFVIQELKIKTFPCTDAEEQAFVEYYELETPVLNINSLIKLSDLENNYPQLMFMLANKRSDDDASLSSCATPSPIDDDQTVAQIENLTVENRSPPGIYTEDGVEPSNKRRRIEYPDVIIIE